MKNVAQIFAELVIAKSPFLEELDELVVTNQVYALVGLTHEPAKETHDLLALRDQLVEVAITNKTIADSLTDREILGSKLMALLAPYPSQVNRQFWNDYRVTPRLATDNYFNFAKTTDYIKTQAIAQNIAYTVPSAYGQIQITINLSKPEKDPKAIAAAGKARSVTYPMCVLCMENEGYAGHLGWAARSEHRIVRVPLNGETWGMQYSPYAYFNEHVIFIAPEHRNMHIDATNFANLLTLVTKFPEYFVGSNADLPIVGGSLLSHDHYQGGRHEFPMALAPIEKVITIPGFNVEAGIVKWPMSVLRLRSTNSDTLVKAATHVLTRWQAYSDETVQVQAVDAQGVQHHTITPIARMRDGQYELDLVLRDNNVSAEHPDGIFHPHQDVQHIKKENIGLIEVMGLAILPARLKSELFDVQRYVLGEVDVVKEYHQAWADELKASYHGEAVDEYVRNAVGQVFVRVLEDAGVFKRDTVGQQAFARFVASL